LSDLSAELVKAEERLEAVRLRVKDLQVRIDLDQAAGQPAERAERLLRGLRRLLGELEERRDQLLAAVAREVSATATVSGTEQKGT